jgi:hypothetical protein
MRRRDREITDIQEIEEIISGCDACRVAIANENIPYIVTMNFGYVGGKNPHLYFHCATVGKKLDMIRNNNNVCFEMDTDHIIYKGEKGCDWGMKYSSIVGYGNIFFVDDETEKKSGLGHIMNHYGGSGNYTYDEREFARTKVLRLDISEMSGKRK